MITLQTMPKTITRNIVAKVEHYSGSTLLNTFYYNDYLQSIEVNRTCEENKLFGFIVSQKATIKIIDRDSLFTFAVGDILKVYFDNGQGYISPFPSLYISEQPKRDTVKKEVTITAYDLITYAAPNYTVTDLDLSGYNILQFLNAVVDKIGADSVKFTNIDTTNTIYTYQYTEGANFNGSETLREALTALADATQTVIFMNYEDRLTLKKVSSTFVDIYTANDYFSFEEKGIIRVNKIAHITELGENLEAKNNIADGTTHYIRNNAFLELREDLADILNAAVVEYEDKVFTLFDAKMRGDYLIEIGDYFMIADTKSYYGVYLMNDSIKYSGGLSQTISYGYKETTQANSNPTTLGETLKLTTAKVDKVNREIELVISEQAATSERIAVIELNIDSIGLSVSSTEENIESLTGAINEVSKEVSALLTEDEIKLEIATALEDGVSKVETSTGFTFNEDGLTVSKSDSEMTTTITEDGMTVYKNNKEVLTANNEGVKAIDLHAETFLIIGKNSRFEDYGNNRTACFWIGG